MYISAWLFFSLTDKIPRKIQSSPFGLLLCVCSFISKTPHIFSHEHRHYHAGALSWGTPPVDGQTNRTARTVLLNFCLLDTARVQCMCIGACPFCRDARTSLPAGSVWLVHNGCGEPRPIIKKEKREKKNNNQNKKSTHKIKIKRNESQQQRQIDFPRNLRKKSVMKMLLKRVYLLQSNIS